MDAPGVDSNIFFESKKELLSGDIVSVRISSADTYDLFGGKV